MRNYKVYLDDILRAIYCIEKYTRKMTYRKFRKNDMALNATIRQLEVIGEAAKNIPENIRNEYQDIEWKKIAGLRDILIHEYFGIDVDIIWDIIKNNIPRLKLEIKKLLEENK